eukprot:CAMPEP_0194478838 /NCGR_PEP_ID=MMETSP0253-20130528/2160_1 /TAXON_ID=2966 /ORGANISM="Noctiluca scintillans" /LENGTH=195 /DNA_ID=CAMNT_0039317989 /DNA_START=66 /DNA_END=653 /DNA_ORIENTATION=+
MAISKKMLLLVGTFYIISAEVCDHCFEPYGGDACLEMSNTHAVCDGCVPNPHSWHCPSEHPSCIGHVCEGTLLGTSNVCPSWVGRTVGLCDMSYHKGSCYNPNDEDRMVQCLPESNMGSSYKCPPETPNKCAFALQVSSLSSVFQTDTSSVWIIPTLFFFIAITIGLVSLKKRIGGDLTKPLDTADNEAAYAVIS